MKINADLTGAALGTPDVTHFEIEAGQLQPWMILLPDDAEDADAGHGLVVTSEPAAYQKEVPGGRVQRWVDVAILDADEPFQAAATRPVTIICGTAPDDLQPLLAEDLYLEPNMQALARNGMCFATVDADEQDEQDDEDIYCGLPSEPASVDRLCWAHDREKQTVSDSVAGRQYAPIYGFRPGI